MNAPQGHLGMTDYECILFNVFPPIPSMYFYGRKLIAEPEKPEQFQKIFSGTSFPAHKKSEPFDSPFLLPKVSTSYRGNTTL
jgi:hypothetical protein